MSYIFVGLGNPGQEYESTRHNTGRMFLEWLLKDFGGEWKDDKKLSAKVAKIKIGKSAVTLVMPETFMNNSGKSIKPLVLNQKSAEKMLVIYDDLDLPFGTVKMSFNKSSGGHRGLESIIKAVKTEKFPRIRVGISPSTPSGKIKKPHGEDAVMKIILGKFKPEQITELKKIYKKISSSLEHLVTDGYEKAISQFNS